jgi:hypothetical protein
MSCHADTNGNNRFAERDQHDEPVALHEVGGPDGEPRHRREEWRDPVQPKGRRPQGPLEQTLGEARPQQQRCSDGVGRPQPAHGPHRALLAGQQEHPGVHECHQQVPHTEGDAAAIEGGGNRQRCDQEAAHGEQQQQPQHRLSWRHGVGQPRIPAVDPPQVAEDQGDAAQARHGRFAGQEAGELGDGEDEDQIEEQLDGRDPDLRRAGPARLRLVGSHALVLTRPSPSRCDGSCCRSWIERRRRCPLAACR